MRLVGASPAPQVTGLAELPGTSNYLALQGGRSVVDVPSYAAVEYQDVYPGIDLVYHGSGQQLEYDFVVTPGADPGAIRMRFQGADGIELDAQGNLVLHTAAGDVVQQAPVIYQGDGADRQAVSGAFVLEADGEVGFAVGAYDATRPLVIDPVLAYGTYLGNSATLNGYWDSRTAGHAIAVDRQGNAYLTGSVSTTEFPTTPGSLQTSFDPFLFGRDAFVTKLNADLSELVYATYLGGNTGVPLPGFRAEPVEEGLGIAVDPSGAAYVVGYTASADFPNVNAVQPEHAGSTARLPSSSEFGSRHAGRDAFVVKLDPSGSRLLYATYLGGTHEDVAAGVATDAAGNAYVVGTTGSTNWPATPGALQETYTHPFGDNLYVDGRVIVTSAFVARLAPSLTVRALPVRAFLGQPFTGIVAGFTSPDPSSVADAYAALIDWGDGSPLETGAIQKTDDPVVPFLVRGSHTYTRQGAFPVVVTVRDIRRGVTATTAYNVTQTAGHQNEPTIAVDPTNPNRLFMASNKDGGGVFAAYSTDGGVTWTPTNPTLDHTLAGGNGPNSACCDPRAVFDQFGNLFFAYVNADHTAVVLLRSKDGGKSFALTSRFPVAESGATEGGTDQPKLAVGPGSRPGTGSVWITYADTTSGLWVGGAEVTGLDQVGPFALREIAGGHP
jgi:hypothetical protein